MKTALMLAALLPLALHAAPRPCLDKSAQCERPLIKPAKTTTEPTVTVGKPAKPEPEAATALPPPEAAPLVSVSRPKAPPKTIYIAPKIKPVTRAPELATGGIATALTLLIGGLMVMLGRRRV